MILQDEADATQYGGELAPGGPPSALPYLSLVPIVQMQAQLQRSRTSVSTPAHWPALIDLLTTGPFQTVEFKRVFNQFSDNIYYASDTAEANVYLLGGATPSSLQTSQYLLRNEALKQVQAREGPCAPCQLTPMIAAHPITTRHPCASRRHTPQVGEVVDELKYQSKQPPSEVDPSVALEYLDAALKAFQEYLALAPPDVLRQAQAALAPLPTAPSAGPIALLGGAAALAAQPHAALAAVAASSAASAAVEFAPRGITAADTFIFVLGCVPFVWAGIEFWRRIAVGDAFGTGRDSVIINDTSGNRSRAVRRVLGQDAIIAARILFGLAFASGALVLLAAGDLLSSIDPLSAK